MRQDGDDVSMSNRVTPLGDIVAIELRGAWMGNRGILHKGTEIVRPFASQAWITCALEYKDWHHPQWQPGHYTILFFHDEAVALAAGHRPCALCRRGAYNAFRRAFAVASGSELPSAKVLDRTLHQERLVAGSSRRRLHQLSWADVPDGAFVLLDGEPGLVLATAVVRWTAYGYREAVDRPAGGRVDVITPPTTVAALKNGYPVQIDNAARSFASQGASRTKVSGPNSATDEYPHNPSVRSNSATILASTSPTPAFPASPSASA